MHTTQGALMEAEELITGRYNRRPVTIGLSMRQTRTRINWMSGIRIGFPLVLELNQQRCHSKPESIVVV